MRKALSNVGGPVETRGDRALAEVLASALDTASREEADVLTHGFHSYPAKMHRAVAGTLLGRYRRDDLRVLDPFVGSGTVIVEALAHGVVSTGVDLNPLALRVAEVKSLRPNEDERAAFLEAVRAVVERSLERVQTREPIQAALAPAHVRAYDPHVLKELAGLLAEIRAEPSPALVRILEIVFSAIVVKFSRQRGDTSTEEAPKRLRKGLASEFFERKSGELVRRWEALDAACPEDAPAPRLYHGDARRLATLLPNRYRADLVISSPPYGGTYDYVAHHALRADWLGVTLDDLERREIGARRRSRADDAPLALGRELEAYLASVRDVLRDDGLVVLLLGDAQLGPNRLSAEAQLFDHASPSGFVVAASASQPRVDHFGGSPRREWLFALTPREASPRRRA